MKTEKTVCPGCHTSHSISEERKCDLCICGDHTSRYTGVEKTVAPLHDCTNCHKREFIMFPYCFYKGHCVKCALKFAGSLKKEELIKYYQQ